MKYHQTETGEQRHYLTPKFRIIPVQLAADLLGGSIGLPDIIEDDEIDW